MHTQSVYLSSLSPPHKITYIFTHIHTHTHTTNHIKARRDKTQQNNKCRLCGDRDETVTHIISECSKLAQKEYKSRHDWVGKVIHWEMCKKFKFDHTNKWYNAQPRICPRK